MVSPLRIQLGSTKVLPDAGRAATGQPVLSARVIRGAERGKPVFRRRFTVVLSFALVATIGNVLSVKPIITLENGLVELANA